MTSLAVAFVLFVVLAATIAIIIGRRAPRRGGRAPAMDPFALGDPWRRHVGAARRAQHRAHRALRHVRSGPLHDRLVSVVARLDHAIEEVWAVARRGDEIDRSIRRLDPTALRSRLATFQQQRHSEPSAELDQAIASVERQLETAERLRVLSNRAATRLRLTTTRLDELVARAEEVGVGLTETDRYRSDVDELVDELEAVRLALDATRGDGVSDT